VFIGSNNLFSEYVQFINVYLLLLVDGEINNLPRKIYDTRGEEHANQRDP
jgi:hypothetical protein